MPQSSQFNRFHLDVLKRIAEKFEAGDEEPASRSGQWLANHLDHDALKHLPGLRSHVEKPDRAKLFDLVADQKNDTAILCAVILAWGGMRTDHARKLFGKHNKWCQAAEDIRARKLHRKVAYARFQELRRQGATPGLGIAYFTKLIFFLGGNATKKPGYILDQWTGCSVNLLTGDPTTVLLDTTFVWTSPTERRSGFFVSDVNDPDRYERYCLTIESLAAELSLTAVETELLLMSQGNGRGEWRDHVIRHRRMPDLIAVPPRSATKLGNSSSSGQSRQRARSA